MPEDLATLKFMVLKLLASLKREAGSRPAQQLGQAEVGDPHPPFFVQQDVFRLDVAVA